MFSAGTAYIDVLPRTSAFGLRLRNELGDGRLLRKPINELSNSSPLPSMGVG